MKREANSAQEELRKKLVKEVETLKELNKLLLERLRVFKKEAEEVKGQESQSGCGRVVARCV
jgi:hypothetical protein